MKSQLVIGAFVVGVLVSASVSVLAGGRTSQDSGGWALAEVDTGSIRAKMAENVPVLEGYKQIDANTNAETEKRFKSLSEKGYEPYAAAAYNGHYSNEKVYFFRKKR